MSFSNLVRTIRNKSEFDQNIVYFSKWQGLPFNRLRLDRVTLANTKESQKRFYITMAFTLPNFVVIPRDSDRALKQPKFPLVVKTPMKEEARTGSPTSVDRLERPEQFRENAGLLFKE